MRLNIETVDAQNTLAILKRNFLRSEVTIEEKYAKTATYNIVDAFNPTEERCYPLESLFDLSSTIPVEKIRIL